MKSDIDLNLLKVLPLLYRQKKIKSVAKSLRKSEASVSKYLARLRQQLDDDLFTLDPKHGYQPTPFIIDMLPDIESNLSALDMTLHRTQFDQSSYTKALTIAVPQLSQYYVGHELLLKIMAEFPNAKINITGWDEHTPQKIMDNQIDIAIQFFSSQLPKTFYQKVMGLFQLSIIVPENNKDISLQDALSLPFVMPQARGWFDGVSYNDLIQQLIGCEVNVVANVENIYCILNSVSALNGATVLSTINKPIPGFHIIPLPIPLDKLPSSCVLMKVQHRHNALHQALTMAVESIYHLYRL